MGPDVLRTRKCPRSSLPGCSHPELSGLMPGGCGCLARVRHAHKSESVGMLSRYSMLARSAAASLVPGTSRRCVSGKNWSLNSGRLNSERKGASSATARYGLYRACSFRNQGPAMLVHWSSTNPVAPPGCTEASCDSLAPSSSWAEIAGDCEGLGASCARPDRARAAALGSVAGTPRRWLR
eukprot:scaffold153929_cov31-Tisochrysis_lutea.AAC.9